MYTTQDMLTFARRHDWGRDAQIIEGGLLVHCWSHHPDRGWFRETVIMRTMRNLRLWAGY